MTNGMVWTSEETVWESPMIEDGENWGSLDDFETAHDQTRYYFGAGSSETGAS